ncbi:hypothetical protein HERIO_579 [Hepatospora eriocheir]|uniref:Uncharacterized protein n=1 Tax=Hepatospora eriocheir TaxID=1081669 RepID=A0A1X0QCR3_9MICR|nr:hypothetical protein HERIO_579 [Hepatospora eriocheir]
MEYIDNEEHYTFEYKNSKNVTKEVTVSARKMVHDYIKYCGKKRKYKGIENELVIPKENKYKIYKKIIEDEKLYTIKIEKGEVIRTVRNFTDSEFEFSNIEEKFNDRNQLTNNYSNKKESLSDQSLSNIKQSSLQDINRLTSDDQIFNSEMDKFLKRKKILYIANALYSHKIQLLKLISTMMSVYWCVITDNPSSNILNIQPKEVSESICLSQISNDCIDEDSGDKPVIIIKDESNEQTETNKIDIKAEYNKLVKSFNNLKNKKNQSIKIKSPLKYIANIFKTRKNKN